MLTEWFFTSLLTCTVYFWRLLSSLIEAEARAVSTFIDIIEAVLNIFRIFHNLRFWSC